MTQADQSGWQRYYAATEGRPPRPTLIRAMDALARPGVAPGRCAVDLGCGQGRDTLAMLARGWRVLAIDAEAEALARLAARAGGGVAGWAVPARLALRQGRLEDVFLPSADLVNASFVLFALRAPAQRRLFRLIAAALRPGGRFAGQLLGPRDSWARRGRCRGWARDELGPLLSGLVIDHLIEEEEATTTPRGEAKRWHLWHVVARKPSGSRRSARIKERQRA